MLRMVSMNMKTASRTNALYRDEFEHENCGIGAVVNIKGVQSHATVDNALTIVETLEHRAGKDAEGKTGDGVGILTQISHAFFTKAASGIGIELPGERDYAVGMFFFPQDQLKRTFAKRMFEVIIEKEGLDTVFSSFFTTTERFLDLPRKQELKAVINRMRKIIVRAGEI